MGTETPSTSSRIGAFFNVLERLVLFALSLSVGLINLLIGALVAARLGVLPKAAADRTVKITHSAAAFVTRIMGAPKSAAPRPAVPKRKSPR